jgi:membrane associated rhomboid family serine protease
MEQMAQRAEESGLRLESVDRYSLFTQRHGYKPGAPTLVSLIFCMFLHGGFLHLAGNMLYLWIFGDNVEARLGPVGYLVAYLATGALATLSFAHFEPDSLTPLVGASGAISGVLGLYLVWFHHNHIRVLVFLFFIMFVHVRALWVLAVYLLWDNLGPWLMERRLGHQGGVAYAAHLGGFIAGMMAALLLNLVRGRQPAPRPPPHRLETVHWNDPRRREHLAQAMENPAHTFRRAMKELRMEDAAHAFSRIVREGGLPPEPEDVFRLAQWLYDSDFVPDAAAVFKYYIRTYPRGADLDRAHLGLGILLSRRLGQPAQARDHFQKAIDLARPGSAISRTAHEELGR